VTERHENSYAQSRPKITLIHGRGSVALMKILWLGIIFKVCIYRRHLKALLFLNRALAQDEGLDEEFRGLRTNAEIAESYAENDPLGYIPSAQAIAAYRSQVHGLIKKAVPPGCPYRLMRTVRGAGVRLIDGIEVIDLSNREE